MIETEATAREKLSGWWELIGQEPEYPASTLTVEKLLQAVEYNCDQQSILHAVDSGWFMPPQRENSRLAWYAADIVGLACALESRRLWKPCSMIHNHKLSYAERLQQLLTAKGEETFSDLAQFDWAAVLGLLHKVSGDQAAVALMAEAIRAKLKTEGINV